MENLKRPKMLMVSGEDGEAYVEDVLWENASPTSAFATQSLNIDTTSYSKIAIIYGSSTAASTAHYYFVIPNSENPWYFSAYEGEHLASRGVIPRPATVYFTQCSTKSFTDVSVPWSATSIYLIPLQIIGIK